MYIFKNPKIGAEVVPHTDNSYLITNPLSCMGIWIALHDATVNILNLFFLIKFFKYILRLKMVVCGEYQDLINKRPIIS